MTDEELAAIQARADAATTGPWTPFENLGVEIVSPRAVVARMMAASNQWRGDTYFIAHAREDVPALLAEVKRLRSQIQEGSVPHGQ